ERLTLRAGGDVDLEALEQLHRHVAADLAQVVLEHLGELLPDRGVPRVQRDALATAGLRGERLPLRVVRALDRVDLDVLVATKARGQNLVVAEAAEVAADADQGGAVSSEVRRLAHR